jgi:HEAT repeat protein
MSHTEQEIIKLLTDHRSEESWMNRQLGAQLAGNQQNVRLEKLVLRLLSDRVDWVRYHAFQALINMKLPAERLVPIAKQLTNDRFFRLRQAASSYMEDTLHEMLRAGASTQQADAVAPPGHAANSKSK